MAEIATLTSKSQLTLPKAIREALGVGPGDQIQFMTSLRGFRIVAMTGDVRRVRGLLKGRVKGPVSVQDMDLAIASHLAEQEARR